MSKEQLEKLLTETVNEHTKHLDAMPMKEVLQVMNDENQNVIAAIERVLPEIESVIEEVVKSFQKGGRLIYVGAGTSGRIGLLDAVECPPTFGTDPNQVVGLIAGGERAFVRAVEGAEDNPKLGEEDLRHLHLTKDDTVIGIAASGRTPYVIGALQYASLVGATTVAIANTPNATISEYAKYVIELLTGPEVLTGSTRLKAGTSQKLVCNMISTGSMIAIGKVYGNLMVDVKVTNYKLEKRALRIIQEIADCDEEVAEKALRESKGNAKTAIVMIEKKCDKKTAETLLKENGNHLGKALL